VKFEHFALNVPDPVAQAEWYVHNLGFSVAVRGGPPAHMHFLADETGRVIVELYHNASGPVPDYPSMHPLSFHFAVIATDAKAERARLEGVGASLLSEGTLPDGSVLVMLRDPWGLPLQLVQRAVPLPST
jgi:catechol 2,3-dioxygenase-like lactoylglutathione lyase family enzyme